MVPKFFLRRLTSKMTSMNEISNFLLCEEPVIREEESREEGPSEQSMKLSLETRTTVDGVTIILCIGRIVYRDEAAALSRTASRLMRDGRNLVLDLSGVGAIDGAGLGEFVGLHNWAATSRCTFKLAALPNHVRNLFELTKLAPVFEIYSTVEKAAVSSQLAARSSQPSAKLA
jgi:anti-anti-sigma factor